MATTPLAQTDDVVAIWRPLSDAETDQVDNLITVASAKLRHAAPFDVDYRIDLWRTDPGNVLALNPIIVANVVATIVKRFLVNPDGYASHSLSVGPYSESGTYVNRYDKTGSDVRGAIEVTAADIEQLRPAMRSTVPSSFRVGIATPAVVVPGHRYGGRGRGAGPQIIPDYNPGSEAE